MPGVDITLKRSSVSAKARAALSVPSVDPSLTISAQKSPKVWAASDYRHSPRQDSILCAVITMSIRGFEEFEFIS